MYVIIKQLKAAKSKKFGLNMSNIYLIKSILGEFFVFEISKKWLTIFGKLQEMLSFVVFL